MSLLKQILNASTLKKNIIANFIGRIWTVSCGIIFIPIYIHFIGIESYGLLGVFASFQAVMALLDMGITTTLNKELAKYSALKNEHQYMNNLVKTMETVYVLISLVVLTILIICSFFLSYNWVNPESLDHDTILVAFILMSVNFSLQLPWGLYEGGLMGLQRQVLLNKLNISLSTIKGPGAIIILWLISPTIQAFMVWQIIVNLVQLILFRYYLWRSIPKAESPRFDKTVVSKSGRFAAGVFGISLLILLLSQTDKIILSKIVKLTELGYYSLAASVASMLPVFVSPIVQAAFPRITELQTLRDEQGLRRLFHLFSQLIASIVLPIGLSIFIFSKGIMLLWTGNAQIAEHAGEVLSFLILGNMFNCLMIIPYQYTLAKGWTGYGIKVTIVALIFYFPFILWSAMNYGIVGSAVMWMILNGLYLVFAIQYLFKNIMQQEKAFWYMNIVIKPVLCSIICVTPFYFLNYYFKFSGLLSTILCGVCILACFSINLFLVYPALNPFIKRFLSGLKPMAGSKVF